MIKLETSLERMLINKKKHTRNGFRNRQESKMKKKRLNDVRIYIELITLITQTHNKKILSKCKFVHILTKIYCLI